MLIIFDIFYTFSVNIQRMILNFFSFHEIFKILFYLGHLYIGLVVAIKILYRDVNDFYKQKCCYY